MLRQIISVELGRCDDSLVLAAHLHHMHRAVTPKSRDSREEWGRCDDSLVLAVHLHHMHGAVTPKSRDSRGEWGRYDGSLVLAAHLHHMHGCYSQESFWKLRRVKEKMLQYTQHCKCSNRESFKTGFNFLNKKREIILKYLHLKLVDHALTSQLHILCFCVERGNFTRPMTTCCNF